MNIMYLFLKSHVLPWVSFLNGRLVNGGTVWLQLPSIQLSALCWSTSVRLCPDRKKKSHHTPGLFLITGHIRSDFLWSICKRIFQKSPLKFKKKKSTSFRIVCPQGPSFAGVLDLGKFWSILEGSYFSKIPI